MKFGVLLIWRLPDPSDVVFGRHLNPRFLLAVGLLTLTFLLPAVLNRSPIIYADTVGYFHMGESVLDIVYGSFRSQADTAVPSPEDDIASRAADGVSTSRSPYYGTFLVLVFGFAGTWGVALAQIAVLQFFLYLGIRSIVGQGQNWVFPILFTTALVGAGVFATTLVPDMFAGLAILAAAILVSMHDRLNRREMSIWLALLTISCLFHKSIILITIIVVIAGSIVFYFRGCRPRGGVWLIIASAFGLFGMLAVNVAIMEVSGRSPADPPHFLARMVGDGTVPKYLKYACPTYRYTLCDYPIPKGMTENQFLWGHKPAPAVYGDMSVSKRRALDSETSLIIARTLMKYPLEQAGASLKNFARQFLSVGVVEFGVMPGRYLSDRSALRHELRRYVRYSAIGRNTMPLASFGLVMSLGYFLGFMFIAAVALSRRLRSNIDLGTWLIVQITLLGVIANAAVCGILGGVFDRYQGRVAWVVPFVALCLAAQLYDRRAAARLSANA